MTRPKLAILTAAVFVIGIAIGAGLMPMLGPWMWPVTLLVVAALAGHDIGEFVPADNAAGGYQAECGRCGGTVWLGDNGLIYSLLAERCPG